MKRQEKILNKLEETEQRINGAFLMFMLAMLLEILLLIVIGRSLELVNTGKFAVGIVALIFIGLLIANETTWFVDFVSARCMSLRNVVKVAFIETKDFEFVGEKNTDTTKEEE